MLSRSCRNEKIVLLPSDYKSMFFKISADIKFMPINLDLVPDFGDFVPPILQVSVQGFLALFRGRSRNPARIEIRRKHAQGFMLLPNLKRAINFPHFDV